MISNTSLNLPFFSSFFHLTFFVIGSLWQYSSKDSQKEWPKQCWYAPFRVLIVCCVIYFSDCSLDKGSIDMCFTCVIIRLKHRFCWIGLLECWIVEPISFALRESVFNLFNLRHLFPKLRTLKCNFYVLNLDATAFEMFGWYGLELTFP